MLRFVAFVGLMVWPALVLAEEPAAVSAVEVVSTPEVLADASTTLVEPLNDELLELKFNQVKPLIFCMIESFSNADNA